MPWSRQIGELISVRETDWFRLRGGSEPLLHSGGDEEDAWSTTDTLWCHLVLPCPVMKVEATTMN